MTEGKGVNDILSSVLENKELMSKISGIVSENKSENKEDALPDVIAAITESLGKDTFKTGSKNDVDDEEKGTITDTGSEKIEEKANPVSSVLSRVKGNRESAALLRAIKPFLSKERCELVDNILKFEQLASLIDTVR